MKRQTRGKVLKKNFVQNFKKNHEKIEKKNQKLKRQKPYQNKIKHITEKRKKKKEK